MSNTRGVAYVWLLRGIEIPVSRADAMTVEVACDCCGEATEWYRGWVGTKSPMCVRCWDNEPPHVKVTCAKQKRGAK